MTPSDIVLGVTLVIAMYTDVRTGKIKNWLTLPVMAAGVFAAPLFGHPWWWGLAGLLVAAALAIPTFMMRLALCAGDVKLLMAAGALIGPKAALYAVLLTNVLNLVYGPLMLAAKGKLGNLRKVAAGEPFEATMVVYGPMVALGTVIARVWQG